MKRNSSIDKRFRTLAAFERRTVLSELANVRDEVESGIRFMEKFGDIVPGIIFGRVSGRILRMQDLAPSAAAGIKEVCKSEHTRNLLPLRNAIRKVWKERDLTARRLGILRIAQDRYHQFLASNTDPSWAFPRDRASRLRIPTPFQQILEYLIRPNVRTSICTNSRCSAPYFFSSRLGQKFCSDACALPAQRKFKRRWWAEHGREWRAKRKKKRVRRKRR
jgi:hypothetical protein